MRMTADQDKKQLARLLNVVLIFGLLAVNNLPESLVSSTSSAETVRYHYIIFNLLRILLAGFSLAVIYRQKSQYQKEFRAYGVRLFHPQRKTPAEARNLPILALNTLLIVLLFVSAVSILISSYEYAKLYQGQFLAVAGHYLFSIGRIAAGWVLWFGAFVGIGLLCRPFFGLNANSSKEILLGFWSGWGISIVFLQCWHFFFKIGWWPFILVFITGAAGILLHLGNIKKVLTRPWRFKKHFIILLIVLAFWMANASNFPPKNYDAGLYDFQAIKWAKSYPIIPGLGNLNIRLSYHNASHLYVALLDKGVWDHFAHRVANSLLIFALAIQVLLSFFAVGKAKESRREYHVFLVLIAPIAIYWASSRYITSPNPDTPLYPLGVILAAMLIDFIRKINEDTKAAFQRLLLIVFLSSVGIAIKLSFTAMAVCCSVIAFGLWLLRRDHQSRKNLSSTALLVFAVAVTLVPWMIRGVILSGYPALPSSIGSVDLEWTIQKEIAENDSIVVRGWARDPTRAPKEVMSDWSWFSPWITETLKRTFDIVAPVICTCVAAFLFMIFCFKTKKSVLRDGLFIVLIPPAASIAFWFFTAPGPQFEGAAFWVLAIVAIASVGMMFERNVNFAFHNLALTVAAVISILFLIALPVAKGLQLNTDEIPEAKLTSVKTKYGLILNVPEKELCWDAPLPCTSTPDSRLKTRSPGDLGSGFVIVKDR